MIIIEDRICEVCGRPMHTGFTDQEGTFYCCDNCFDQYMDRTFGKHRWMQTSDDHEGGYYVFWSGDEDEEIQGTGIYWTEWED